MVQLFGVISFETAISSLPLSFGQAIRVGGHITHVSVRDDITSGIKYLTTMTFSVLYGHVQQCFWLIIDFEIVLSPFTSLLSQVTGEQSIHPKIISEGRSLGSY
jgi:hypothetical protein